MALTTVTTGALGYSSDIATLETICDSSIATLFSAILFVTTHLVLKINGKLTLIHALFNSISSVECEVNIICY